MVEVEDVRELATDESRDYIEGDYAAYYLVYQYICYGEVNYS